MAPTRIHHVNFVVRDLDLACAHFERVLGVEPFEVVDHAPRGSHIARSRIGESWLVLVCPYDADSVPGRFLADHGEGLFLLSVGVEDLANELERLEAAGEAAKMRGGILDWRVADVAEVGNSILQLSDDA